MTKWLTPRFERNSWRLLFCAWIYTRWGAQWSCFAVMALSLLEAELKVLMEGLKR
jgi:hypothetical protein